MTASIKPLQEAVRSSLRSGIFLFDFTRVVEELVFNSLDARATKVSVFVGVGRSYLKVVDNGSGITRDGLELVGERYATSKFLNLVDLNVTSENFGFRGEALASISDVSVLEIVTRTHGRPNGYQKVLKGCKCLYLGIDDDRKEVGTTVVVRDLFYNQPVRRKCIQSSPNKVLQSIKKCVMRLALVRPNISFKVVDIEREDELFCTHSASSPLSLITSGFGVEVTSSLHYLEVENDIIKLSGYVSSPCNTSNIEVLQYVYVNSQFVCKGPIHKLLSQLVVRFEHQNSWTTDNEFRNKKRSRCHLGIAYLLDLSCPRSMYDLAFEPSKTYVKFKDWTPILNFIEKVIKQFWEENIASAEPSNQFAYMVEDQQEKAYVSVISDVPDMSRFRNQNRKDCLDLFFSTSDKLIEDDYHQSNREDVRTSIDYLETAMFKEKQSIGDSLFQTGYSGNLFDDSHAKCISTVTRRQNSLLMHDSSSSLKGDNFFYSEIPAIESLNDCVAFDAPSCSHGRKFHKEADAISEAFQDDLHYDCNGHSFDVNINGDLQKPFLKGCSTPGSILLKKDFFINDGYEIQKDSFISKQNTGGGKDLNDDVPFDEPSSSHGRKFDKEADMISESFQDDLCYNYNGYSYDVNINGELQKPFLKGCSALGSILSKKDFSGNDNHELQTDSFCSKQNTGEDYRSGKDLYVHPFPEVKKKLKMSKNFDFLERPLAEENILPSDLCYSASQIGSSDSDDRSLNFEWHPLYLKPSSQGHALGFYSTTDIKDDIGGVSRCLKWIHHKNRFDERENECNFSYNTSWNTNQHHCASSYANIGFNFDVAGDSGEIFNKLGDCHDFSDIYSTKRSDMLKKKLDWLLPESCVKRCKLPNKDKGKTEKFRNSTVEENHERSRRSISAPPFYRSKRRFFSLNHPSEIKAKRQIDRVYNPGFNHEEASNSKDPQQPPVARHESSKDLLLQEFKINVKQTSKVLGAMQVNDITEIEELDSFNIQNCAPFGELLSKDVQDPIDYGTKWRNCSPDFTNDRPANTQCRNNILDISSGLHLAGDSLIPETISKKCLEDAKVLHQVDKKFIPVVAGRTLVVIDQHAADERIRLEEMRQKVLSGEAKTVTYLHTELELVLPEIGYQLLHSYSEQIKDWGWICNIHANNSETFRRNLDVIKRQETRITLIAVPCILGVKLNDVDLLEFLQQLADTDGSSTVPPSVIRLLNSKACRGAIMFGDSLLPSECSLLVEELKHTSLCFQCAHGRPTTVPLVNLEALHSQIAKLRLMNDSSSKKWHGLRKHKLCVERVAQRLNSAMED
ncbi:DNA mismatch repair protein MLH3 isoform X4 [Vigna umbellata]|uniref:DNA mismatch repair protein MLH3 isoform X3 n=1 Tax=Vigna umbellata TaxID=87088 RepID=UPI001F5FE1B1|nr:DNA mismatch repair protein MLH3 isoform X3 [Vigna umbellata]XP_047158414.1 DNA mismatch repair protein MLH3 isoform X4 [Vigna umbellata]